MKDQLILCETDKGRWAVRPISWASIFDVRGRISEDIRHLAVFDRKEDANWFIQNKEAADAGLLMRLPKELADLDTESLQYALTYAVCMVRYGVMIDTERVNSAAYMSAQLAEAFMHGQQYEINKRITEERAKNEY